ncbi:MAG: hypothetical protein A2174_02380 [Candidatus Portnoybacteria bacterium RBG_13_41_18]|uniref:Thymidylate kinase-like domain-containing protein n=1 Tax=Candidatus Portnoybacteria bacterium RBG_13_41_18 TaxID=1801991 RepID=A0A1G2FA63_9BACT|nr:MAG: hypothetical protein A2174_02380 [Candidatus Portnoybacteria bacterium RBG_13_41_18]
MIIELFGLPGAGKTTLARELAQNYGFVAVKVSGFGELIILNFIFLFENPIKFIAGLYFILTNSKNFYYKVMNCFFQHNAKFQKAKRMENAVIDQGHFQNLLSVLENAVSFGKMEKYAGFFPKPDKLIVLNVEPDLAQARLSQRGWTPRQSLGKQYLTQWSLVIGQNYRTFLDNIDKFDVAYSIIDAFKTPSEILTETMNAIKI